MPPLRGDSDASPSAAASKATRALSVAQAVEAICHREGLAKIRAALGD